MEHFLWKIADVFQIAERGIIIGADKLESDACPDVPAGSTLQVRLHDGSQRNYEKFSIGMIDPPAKERPRHFFLIGANNKRDIPIGSELWCITPVMKDF